MICKILITSKGKNDVAPDLIEIITSKIRNNPKIKIHFTKTDNMNQWKKSFTSTNINYIELILIFKWVV